MSNLAQVVSRDSDALSQETFSGSRSWYAIQTWPQYEKKVAAEFQRKDIEVFLPLRCAKRAWSDRLAIVQVPLFPSYVFVRLEESSNARISVLRTNGVAGFVGIRGRGVSIPQAQIESVRLVIRSGVAFQHHLHLTVGRRIRIRGGCLDGVEGTLLDKKEDLSMLVSIQMIQRSLVLRVAGYSVEAV